MAATSPTPSPRFSRASLPVAVAVRRVLQKGYHRADLRADITAGIVVGVVALPLSMALAIATGVPPQHGLYSAIVAGAVVALLGGSKLQVTGPSAGLVVVLAPVVAHHGLAGVLTAGFMAGIILLALGAARLGNLIRFIPYPVTMGFTTGIGVVMASFQLGDLLGLTTGPLRGRTVDKLAALWHARGTMQPTEVLVAGATLGLLFASPRLAKRAPGPLVAIASVSIGVAILHHFVPAFTVATLGSRFHTVVGGVTIAGIPSGMATPGLPWGATFPSLAMVSDVVGPAFAIAMLGAIETLLAAVVADGMTNTKHDPNAELVAVGIGNLVAPLFGGIAATGALARTATNIRSGARSPVAAIVHAAFVLVAVLLLAPFVAYVPMAALAALLVVVAWNMADVPGFLRLVRVAPRSDVAVLLTCLVLTVFVDMVVAISVGFMLAAVLFMRRMSDLTEARLVVEGPAEGLVRRAPRGVMVYEIDGPLFFGAAQKAMATLATVHADARVLVLHLGRVPVIDVTGLVALEGAITSIERMGLGVVLAGPLPNPTSLFDRARLHEAHPTLQIAPSLEAAIDVASALADARPSRRPPGTTSLA